jgi:hypothetical protein
MHNDQSYAYPINDTKQTGAATYRSSRHAGRVVGGKCRLRVPYLVLPTYKHTYIYIYIHISIHTRTHIPTTIMLTTTTLPYMRRIPTSSAVQTPRQKSEQYDGRLLAPHRLRTKYSVTSTTIIHACCATAPQPQSISNIRPDQTTHTVKVKQSIV